MCQRVINTLCARSWSHMKSGQKLVASVELDEQLVRPSMGFLGFVFVVAAPRGLWDHSSPARD